jgi:hypothetical protein
MSNCWTIDAKSSQKCALSMGYILPFSNSKSVNLRKIYSRSAGRRVFCNRAALRAGTAPIIQKGILNHFLRSRVSSVGRARAIYFFRCEFESGPVQCWSIRSEAFAASTLSFRSPSQPTIHIPGAARLVQTSSQSSAPPNAEDATGCSTISREAE